MGNSSSHLIPNTQAQINRLRGRYQRAWEQQQATESSYHAFYRQIRPSWAIDRSVLMPDKKLRIVLARFRAGCYLLNAGPRHSYQPGSTDRSCPCCPCVSETPSHFLFDCPAYEQERARFGIHGTSSASLQRVFLHKRSKLQLVAKYIVLAWRKRELALGASV